MNTRNVNNLNLQSPWYELLRKFQALFGGDPDISIAEDYERSETGYILNVAVRNHEKFIALDRMLEKNYVFGNIRVRVILYDLENEDPNMSMGQAFQAIFEGNPRMEDIKVALDITGTPHTFVRFKPEVVQFFNDNLQDFEGNWSGLAQDIAKEVFSSVPLGVHFCTATPRPASDKVEGGYEITDTVHADSDTGV